MNDDDRRKILAHIDQWLIDNDRAIAQIHRTRQEIDPPWQITAVVVTAIATMMTVGAALFAAGWGLGKSL